MPEAEDAPREIAVGDTLRRARQHLPGVERGLRMTFAFAAFGALGRLVLPIVLMKAIDDGIRVGEVQVGTVARLCLFAALATVLTEISTRVAAYRLGTWSEATMASLRRGCVDRFLGMSLDQHARERRGVLVARATTDVESISRFFEWGAIAWLVNSVIVIVLSGYLLLLDLRLGAIAIVVVLPVALVMKTVQHRLLGAYDAVRGHVGAYLGRAGEIVTGAAVIRAYQAEDIMRTSTAASIEGRRRASIRAGTLGAFLFPVGDLFSTAAVATIVVVGVHLGPETGLTQGTIIAVIFATIRLLDPVSEISENLDQTQLAVAGLSRVLDVLDLPVELAADVDAIDLPPGPLGVSLDHVWYRYPARRDEYSTDGADTWALKDVSFAVPAGTSLAIVGATGSGKSTTARLLARMSDPQRGTICVQSINARHIREQMFRTRVQLVPQEPFLFDLSIAENLRGGRPSASTADLRAAIDRLGLADWFESLPAGLSTHVGERGADLSAGERQLVALVRAEVVGPDVLVLDEATSSVDAATEARLAAAIERIGQGRTMIVIAHRLSTAARMDRIAVMEHGRIVEIGTHGELLANGGTYARSIADWTSSLTG